jgi:hypothetical protein
VFGAHSSRLGFNCITGGECKQEEDDQGHHDTMDAGCY